MISDIGRLDVGEEFLLAALQELVLAGRTAQIKHDLQGREQHNA